MSSDVSNGLRVISDITGALAGVPSLPIGVTMGAEMAAAVLDAAAAVLDAGGDPRAELTRSAARLGGHLAELDRLEESERAELARLRAQERARANATSDPYEGKP
jgi:hypothetical protein